MLNKKFKSIVSNLSRLINTGPKQLSAFVLVLVMLQAAFLFTGHARAQDFSQFVMPSEVCKSYSAMSGYTIVRNLENDCLARTSDGNKGFVYVHAYNSSNNFCVEITTSTKGQGLAPACTPISDEVKARQQQADPGKLTSTPAFHIRELQYDTLPTGTPIQAGGSERIEIKMPDGSLIQLDANATFTPVSKYEVQSVFGRYRYLWTPFHDGKCIVGQNLARQACRKVNTRDAVLGVTGTEFLVNTDESGTIVRVLEGLLTVTDLGGQKTVEVAGGQYTYIKHGGLPDDPTKFDPAKINRWWTKKTVDQTAVFYTEIIVGFVAFIIIVSAIAKRSSVNRNPALASVNKTKPVPLQRKPKSKIVKIIQTIIAITIGSIIVLYVIGYIIGDMSA